MTRAQITGGWLVVPSQSITGVRIEVPVSRDLEALLTPWLGTHDHMVILPSRRGTPLNQQDFQKRLRAACDKAGLPADCTLHGLRYAAAGVLNELGCDWVTIADVCGWQAAELARKSLS